MKQYQIDVDEQVFEFLQRHAVPFVDTPNAILRRLLLEDPPRSAGDARAMSKGLASKSISKSSSSQAFMEEVLGREFKGESRRADVLKTRRLFEFDRHLAYFLSFSKAGSPNLWFKVTEPVGEALLNSSKPAVVIFANAADRIYYRVPVNAIKKRMAELGTDQPVYPLGINIDRNRHIWRELAWDIGKYLKTDLE